MVKKFPDLKYERRLWRQGYRFVAGADEVGRGALAGPVVAGAVVFDDSAIKLLSNEAIKIDDSKKLSAKMREKARGWIKKNALAWGVGEASVATINRVGIAKATKMAFRAALNAVSLKLDFVLLDAFYVPFVRGLRRKNQLAIIDGDEKSISIAAASIVAKVYRDKLMVKLSRKYKKYGWGKNKGYGTRGHQEAIKKWGITRLHRRKFVRRLLEEEG